VCVKEAIIPITAVVERISGARNVGPGDRSLEFCLKKSVGPLSIH